MQRSAKIVCACACLGALALLARGMPPADGDAAPRFQIGFATFLGGKEWDQAREVMPYPDGTVLVGAQVMSDDMPITEGVLQSKYAGDKPVPGQGGLIGGDCYLAHLSADGSKLLAASYFGGSRQERNVYGMGLDRQGNVVICTTTRSWDIPTTPGCFQAKFGGGETDILVAKLTPDLKKLLWCTYLGGSGTESPRGGLTIDPQDNVYLVGTTTSPNFPTTQGSYQGARGGQANAVIVKLKADGSGLLYSTCLGGTGSTNQGIMGIRTNAAGELFLGGHTTAADFPTTPGAPQSRLGGRSDSFIARFSASGDRLISATYLGGSGNEFAEHQIAVDPDGTAILTGVTGSPDFPTTPGAVQRAFGGKTDGFITALSPDGKRFLFSTYLGGSGGEFFLMPTRDAQGSIYVVGTTSSRDFPVTPDAAQPKFGGGANDGVLAVLSPDGSKLVYSTYVGGSGDDLIRSLALTTDGAVYLVGNTDSADFPVTANALQAKPGGGTGDCFVVKLAPNR